MVKLIRRISHISLSASFHDWLLVSCTFSLLLLAIRIILTGSIAFSFLAWNLFLAIIPYLISWYVINQPTLIKNRKKLVVAFIIWLLFIPNTFYILTDLFHLDHFDYAPQWFELALLLSFAWNGLLCGIISIRRFELIILTTSLRKFSVPVVYGVMLLNAFGIYIGRFLRYNSWDVLSNPLSLFTETILIVLKPWQHTNAWGMTLAFSVLMTIMYYTLRKMNEQNKIQGRASGFRHQASRTSPN